MAVPDSVPGLRTVKGMFSYGRRSLREEVLDALHMALSLAAHADPAELRQTLRPLHDSDLFPVHETLGYAYEHAACPMVADALEWCANRRVRGLDRYMTPGWAWGAALSQIAAAGDAGQRTTALDLVAAVYPPAEVPVDVTRESMPTDGRERVVVLGQLSRRLGPALPATLSEDLHELERVTGPAATTAKPQEVEFTPRSTAVSPPTVDSSDQQWIDAINALAASDENNDDDDDDGLDDIADATADAMAVALHDQTQKAPIRFARILLAATGASARLTSAVLRGIVEGVNAIDDADQNAVIELITTLEARGSATRQVGNNRAVSPYPARRR